MCGIITICTTYEYINERPHVYIYTFKFNRPCLSVLIRYGIFFDSCI